MKNLIAATLVILVFGTALFAAYTLGVKNKNTTPNSTSNTDVSPTETLLGGDRDEHGCIPSAGYLWCEEKQKCLREWEEACKVGATPTADESDTLKTVIKQAIVAKHGTSANSLTISVTKISGDYAQGGASEVGAGGGMWFAAKVNGNWKLVWDGNGIITCKDLSAYPDFPPDMIPECFDESSQKMMQR